jgi:hypothetical protein
LLQVKQAAADKMSAKDAQIADLQTQIRELGGEPVCEPSEPTAGASSGEKSSALDALLMRAWHEGAARRFSSTPPPAFIVFRDLLSRVAVIAFDHGIFGGDRDSAADIDEVVLGADDTLRNTYSEWQSERQAEEAEDEVEDADDDAA